VTALDPRPEGYAHAAAIAAMLERAKLDHPEVEDGGAPSSEPDVD
jgi:hypothetical protein